MNMRSRLNLSGNAPTQTARIFKVIIANRKFEIECKNQYVFNLCSPFLARFDKPDEVIRLSQEELAEAAAGFDVHQSENSNVIPWPASFCVENEAIHRRVTRNLLPVNKLHLHGAAVVVENRCWIFFAPSGTGKTTHMHNWLKTVPGAWILDGDKPFIDLETGLVYSSPWCGKEHECVNSSAPLAGLIHLVRGQINSISPIPLREMLPSIFSQTFIPPEAELTEKACELLSRLLSHTPLWRLSCTADPESALVSWEALSKSLS